MTDKHDIKYGDTLTSIAKKYNTTPDILFNMNSHIIKDIDLIYANDSIKVPELVDLGVAERVEPIVLPSVKLQQKQCTVPSFVDALLVPRDPNEADQSAHLILLNEDAKAAVVLDDERCKQALLGDKKAVITQLNQLGVMDQFNSAAHERVLEMKDEKLHLAYKEALWSKKDLSVDYSKRNYTLPKDNSRIELEVESDLAKIEERYQRRLSEIRSKSKNGYISQSHYHATNTLSVVHATKIAEEIREERIRKLQEKTIVALNKTIANFEGIAISHAKTLNTDDGDKFGFDDSKRYYTANEDLKVDACLKRIADRRKGMNLWDEVEEKELTEQTNLPSLTDAYDTYNYWKTTAHPRVAIAIESPKPFDEFFIVNRGLKPIHFDFYRAIYELNQVGYYVKEQSLTEDELFAGYADVDDFIAYENDDRPSVVNLLNALETLNRKISISADLGYYSAYVLNLFLLQVIARRLKEFAERFGENASYGKYVRRLFTYKEHAAERCDQLRIVAEENPGKVWDYQKTKVAYLEELVAPDPESKKTLWSEHQFIPRNLNNLLMSQVKTGQRTIVECALSSDPSKVLYILSDNPVLSSQVSKNSQCTHRLKLNNVMHDERAKEDLGKALKGAFGSGATASLGSISIFKMEHGGSWETLPDVLLSWQSHDLFGTNNVETSASAQFARYVFSGESGVDQNTISAQGAAINAQFVGGLEAASTQVTWKAKFPTVSQELRIPYLTKENSNKKEATIGKTQFIVEGKLYGAVAASVKIGTELHVGNLSPNGNLGNFGVAGRIPQVGEYDTVRTSTSGGVAGGAAGSKIESKAFAGLEVGGKLSCDFRWEPLVDKNRYDSPRTLFKVATGLKMTAGIGVDGVLQCTYQNGRFIFILAYSQTQGLGFGGKVATELNPKEAGDFFAKILEISKSNDFKRFLFFDESEGADTFAAFNTVLTVAASYGLTLSQVLALPFNIIDDMETLATDKENGHFVANFLNDEEYLKQNRHWIENMPAETLAKLLEVLCYYSSIPTFDAFGIMDIDEERKRAATNNQSQRQAVNKILGWMCGKIPTKTNIHRFENALQRMGLDKTTELDKKEQWQRYVDNIMRLRIFFEQAFDEQYKYQDSKKNYMKTLSDDYIKFKGFIMQLTKNMKVMQKISYSGHTGILETREYRVYEHNEGQSRYQELKKQGYRLTDWMSI